MHNNPDEVFGSFYLNDNEFAISAAYVQEVVHAPTKLTEMPLAPNYLLGLFNLRGVIIPLISLQKLLCLPEAPSAGEKKVAIVEHGAHCIGFLFEKTGEIFRSHSDERNDFADSQSASVVSGVFKKDEGKRLVQILNVPQLFQLQGLPLQSGDKTAPHHQRSRAQRGLRKQCISFNVGFSKCALGIHEIQEILKLDQLHDTALSINKCIGVLNVRGATVPIIDFASLLGYREPDISEEATKGSRRIIVLKIEHGLFGLLVDSVDSIVAYHQENLKPLPLIQNERSEMFNSCISIDDQDDILLLNYDKILKNKEIIEITHGHSKLFQAQNQKNVQKETQDGFRNTFITFQVAGLYAVRIDEVREIIEYPSDLLHPPGLPPYCKGLLNHRGEIVMVIDARNMYDQPQKTEASPGKVLIFKHDLIHFGLVVDSVEGIKTFVDKNKMKLPESLYKQSTGPAADAVEAVQIKEPGQDKEITLFVLSLDSLAGRVLKQQVVIEKTNEVCESTT